MKLVNNWNFVIEVSLPRDDGKGGIVTDKEGKKVYDYHWFSGTGLVPGTGEVKNGKMVPAVAGNLWSPYFIDAAIYKEKDLADHVLKEIVQMDGAYVIEIAKSQFAMSWTKRGPRKG